MNNSDRCVYFTKPASERGDAAVFRKYDRRTAMLEMVRAINTESVHVLNPNRANLVWSEKHLLNWGIYVGILSFREVYDA